MKLGKFISKLRKIEKRQGSDLQVIMADNILVVEPVFSEQYHGKKVVITDEETN